MSAERRQRNLTPADVEDIVNLLQIRSYDHNGSCRFNSITQEDLAAAIIFYKNANTVIEDSKNTIRKTVLSVLVVTVLGLLGWGAVLKITTTLPKGGV